MYSESSALDDKKLASISAIEVLLQINQHVEMPVRFRQLCEYSTLNSSPPILITSDLAKTMLSQRYIMIWNKVARLALTYDLNQLYHTVVYCGSLYPSSELRLQSTFNAENSENLRADILELQKTWKAEAKTKKCIIS